ncbi:MAG TPA: DUF6538 domain-containing protein [Beijerinckiaceae bacterium]|jgi:hypothetical protein
MALAMTRPWKHPKTGVYWLRKRVPADLVPVLQRHEEKQSLKTKDPAEAKRALVAALAAIETRWANLRQGPQTLTEREAHAKAQVVHDGWLAWHRDNPSEQTFWPVQLGDRVLAPPQASPAPFDPETAYRIYPDQLKVRELEAWCLAQADDGLAALGLVVDEPGRHRFARAIAMARRAASRCGSPLRTHQERPGLSRALPRASP